MLDLTWWQLFALVGTVVASVFGGRLLGQWAHRAIYRRALLTRSTAGDRIVLRLEAPIESVAIVVVATARIPRRIPGRRARVLPHGRTDRALALDRLVRDASDRRRRRSDRDAVAMDHQWTRGPAALLPLARRVTKIAVGVVIASDDLHLAVYATGPLLVVVAIAGVVALTGTSPAREHHRGVRDRRRPRHPRRRHRVFGLRRGRRHRSDRPVLDTSAHR